MPVANPGYHLCFWLTSYSLEVPKTSFNSGCQFQVQVVWYFWQSGYRSVVPMTHSLGSINLLEWLTELKETLYWLGNQFIVKAYISETARWKRWIGQGVGEGCGASVPSPGRPLSPNLQVFTSSEALQTASFGFLWRLHYTGMND